MTVPSAIETELQSRPAFGRTATRVLAVAALVVALALPRVLPNDYYVHILCVAMLYGVLAASWDLLFGGAGQISFGHAGFFGVGAYGSALTSHYLGINPWVTLWIGAVLAAAFGAVVAIPSMRLKGVYLALTSLAFAELARIVAVNWQSVTRGTLGFTSHPPLPGFGYSPHPYYYAILAFTVLSVGFMYWLARVSKAGLVMRAVRADDLRAEALGADIFRYKLGAFTASAFFAGAAGAFYAHYVHIITPGEMEPRVGVLIIAMAIIGGTGTIIGPAFAGVLIYVLTEQLAIIGPVYKFTAVGLMLILFVLFLPKGISGLFERQRKPGRTPEVIKRNES